MKQPKRLLLFVEVVIVGFLPYFFLWLVRLVDFRLGPLIASLILCLLILLFVFIVIGFRKRFKKISSSENGSEPHVLFIYGAICVLMFYLLWGKYTVDIYIHDTYYILPAFFIILSVAISFVLIGLIYFAFLKFIHRPLIPALARFHFWLTFIAVELLLSEINFYNDEMDGLAGAPRRYVEYSRGWAVFANFQYANLFVRFTVFVTLLAQIIFLINILTSFFRRSKPANP